MSAPGCPLSSSSFLRGPFKPEPAVEAKRVSRARLKNGVLLLGKLVVVNEDERRTPSEFLEARAPPVPVWEIGLVLYQSGLSFRKTAKVCGGVVLEQEGWQGTEAL